MMKIRYYNEDMKELLSEGTYDRNLHLFSKTVNKKSHYMKVLSSYGIQEGVIEKLKNFGCKYVRLREEGEDGKLLISHLSDWVLSATFNFGCGRQKFLSVKKMRKLL